VLPDGTGWAYADAQLARCVVDRLGAVDDVVGRLRGSLALGSPELQALERAALAQIGWSLLDAERRGARRDDGRHELIVRGSVGVRTTFTAEVSAGRRVAIPVCGAPTNGTETQIAELEVGDLEVRRDHQHPINETTCA
jgi:hypothetical protein